MMCILMQETKSIIHYTTHKELRIEECRDQPIAGGLFDTDVAMTGPASTSFSQ